MEDLTKEELIEAIEKQGERHREQVNTIRENHKREVAIMKHEIGVLLEIIERRREPHRMPNAFGDYDQNYLKYLL